jgi:hypothetical protein
MKNITGWTVTAAEALRQVKQAAKAIVWDNFTAAHPVVAAKIYADMMATRGVGSVAAEYYGAAREGHWGWAATYPF